jgi:hypothetical protein
MQCIDHLSPRATLGHRGDVISTYVYNDVNGLTATKYTISTGGSVQSGTIIHFGHTHQD